MIHFRGLVPSLFSPPFIHHLLQNMTKSKIKRRHSCPHCLFVSPSTFDRERTKDERSSCATRVMLGSMWTGERETVKAHYAAGLADSETSQLESQGALAVIEIQSSCWQTRLSATGLLGWGGEDLSSRARAGDSRISASCGALWRQRQAVSSLWYVQRGQNVLRCLACSVPHCDPRTTQSYLSEIGGNLDASRPTNSMGQRSWSRSAGQDVSRLLRNQRD
jgi:hypothetical protein